MGWLHLFGSDTCRFCRDTVVFFIWRKINHFRFLIDDFLISTTIIVCFAQKHGTKINVGIAQMEREEWQKTTLA